MPGYYRPTKNWDLLVVEQDRLVAAIELKSQVGPSFGNNFNNRIEEGLGNATDLWRAYEAGTFGTVRPWIGYVFLLEDSPKSTKTVKLRPTYFPVEPIFHNTSYADRYGLFCKRLVRERLYDAVWFVMSSNGPETPVTEPDPELSYENFVASVKGRATYLDSLPKV